MKIYLLFLALLPVSCFMIWIYYKDRYEKEPPKTLLKYFLLGILVSILSIFIELYLNKLDIFYGLLSSIYIAIYRRRTKVYNTNTNIIKGKKLQ